MAMMSISMNEMTVNLGTMKWLADKICAEVIG